MVNKEGNKRLGAWATFFIVKGADAQKKKKKHIKTFNFSFTGEQKNRSSLVAAAGVEQPIFLESGSGILTELRSTVSSVRQQEVKMPCLAQRQIKNE